MIIVASREEKELLTRLRELSSAVGASQAVDTAAALSAEVVSLKRQIADLEIQRSKIEEEFLRKERDLKHMIGLERQRQDQAAAQQRVEVAQAASAAKLDVREENLAAERKRFEDQLAFNTQRFDKMEDYLKGMVGDILRRLPDVNVALSGEVQLARRRRG